MSHGNSDPLHQGRQHNERPGKAHRHECYSTLASEITGIQRERAGGVRVHVYVCVRRYIIQGERREQAKRKHGRANWLSKFQAGLNQDVSPCSPEHEYLKREIYEPRSFMGRLRGQRTRRASPPSPPHPSHGISRKEGRSLAEDHDLLWLTRRAGYASQPLCKRDGRMNQGKDRGCPHPEMPRRTVEVIHEQRRNSGCFISLLGVSKHYTFG